MFKKAEWLTVPVQTLHLEEKQNELLGIETGPGWLAGWQRTLNVLIGLLLSESMRANLSDVRVFNCRNARKRQGARTSGFGELPLERGPA